MMWPSTKLLTWSVARVESSCGGSSANASRSTFWPVARGGSPLEQPSAIVRAQSVAGRVLVIGGSNLSVRRRGVKRDDDDESIAGLGRRGRRQRRGARAPEACPPPPPCRRRIVPAVPERPLLR